MTHEEIRDMIFQEIKKEHFKIKKSGTAEIYTGCIKTIFFIRGINWMFCIETNKDDIYFYAQPTDNIDKFKFSRSTFAQQLTIQDFKCEYGYHTIIHDIKMIKYHPCISFCYDNSYSGLYQRSYLWTFFKIKSHIWWTKFKDNTYNTCFLLRWNHIIKYWNKNIYVKEAKLIDLNEDGAICFPRYHIRIEFKEDVDEKTMDEALNTMFKHITSKIIGYRKLFDYIDIRQNKQYIMAIDLEDKDELQNKS